MNYLINMNKNLRIGILYIGFASSIVIGIIIDSLLLVGFGFFLVGLLIYTSAKYADIQKQKIIKSAYDTFEENNFKYTDAYITKSYFSGIAINTVDEKIAILNRGNLNDDFTIRVINFSDILESTVIEDGVTITKSSKGSLIGGAAIGGMIAGGVGAVIGGLSGTKTSKDSSISMTLSILVNDLINPIESIIFLHSPGNPIKKNTVFYDEIRNDINKWHKTISVILKRNELNKESV